MSTTPQKKTVLITGCSTHGLGYALALAFHDAGFRVFATARDETKMQGMIDEARIRTRRKKGRHSRAVDHDEVDESGDVHVDVDIDLLKLDVLDESSIASCVTTVEQLIDDGARQGRNAQGLSCLINNAGGGELGFLIFIWSLSVCGSPIGCLFYGRCRLVPLVPVCGDDQLCVGRIFH